MPALYGLVPNAVQQHIPVKSPTADTSVRITPEKAPDLVVAPPKKVIETPRANASTHTNVSADQKPDKSFPKVPETSRSETDPKPTAESKVEAAAHDALTPSDLAELKAEDLARAREHASQYREYKERTEQAQNRDTATLNDDPSDAPKLDVRLPLVDEIPDRPVPRLGVPNV